MVRQATSQQVNGRPSIVKTRIEARLRILRKWETDGVPPGQFVPRNLTQARKWNAPDLGIQRIISPNEFTKTHPAYGKLVTEINQALINLRLKSERCATPKRIVKPDSGAIATENKKLRGFLEGTRQQLEHATRQWRAVSDEVAKLKRAANIANAQMTEKSQKIASQREEIAKKNLEISELRRQIASRQELRIIK